MSDTVHDRIYALAEPRAGFFTTAQAVAAGMDPSTVRHHARPGGRFERVGHGLYRLRHFPSGRFDHVYAAWVPLAHAGAVVSHETALDLHELSDLIPDAVDLTLPRARRGQRPREGVRLHTSKRHPSPNEVRELAGLPVTSPERTIADAFEGGSQPDQLELAVRQALARGITTTRRLHAAAAGRHAGTRAFLDSAIERAEHR
jgi:predicted transcriptional regulator of viral defense system